MTVYKHLIITGGGLIGLCYIGCIKYLYEVNLMDEIEEYTGTSIGALICAMLNLDHNMDDIVNFLKINRLIDKRDISMYNLLNNYGLNNGNNFRNTILKYSNELEMRFDDFQKKTKRKLTITAVSLSKCRVEYFNYINTPDLRIIDAICMSCCIPFLFTPIVYNDELYIDGGLLVNKYDIDEQYNIIYIEYDIQIINKMPCTILDYIANIIRCLLTNTHKEYKKNILNISINCSRYQLFSFDYMDRIDEMVEYGYNETELKLRGNPILSNI